MRDFLVVQWLRIRLAMQRTHVQSLVRELRSHVLQLLSPWATTGESVGCNETICMMQGISDIAKKTNKKSL